MSPFTIVNRETSISTIYINKNGCCSNSKKRKNFNSEKASKCHFHEDKKKTGNILNSTCRLDSQLAQI